MSEPFVPPPGSENDDLSPNFQAFLIIMVIIVVLAITFRFWSRTLRTPDTERVHRYWWDDWFALAATPVVLGQLAVSFVNVHLGFGRHIWTIPPENIALMLKNIFSIYLIYDFGLCLAKISALFFLQRIFPPHANSKWFNGIVYFTYGLNVAWLLGIVFGTVFMCDPIQRNWDLSLEGTCGSTTSLFIGSAVPSVVIDLIILLLPIPKIWRLQTSRARKLGITVIFVFGYGVVVVSLGRLIQVLTAGDALDRDLTYAGVPVVYWVTAEPPVTLLSVCLPALLPLGRFLSKNYFSPLASKVSVILSSRRSTSGIIRSRSGDFSSSDAERTGGLRLRSAKSSNTMNSYKFTEWEPLPSMDNRREIPRMSPNQDQYSASVHPVPQNGEVPSDHIRVDSDVQVHQHIPK